MPLKELAECQQLTTLILSSCTEITDKCLEEVAKLQKLEELDLSFTGVKGAGLGELAKLPRLHTLKLDYCCNITDKCLKEVAKLQHLTYLSLKKASYYDVKFTKAGVAELKKAFSNGRLLGSRCKIVLRDDFFGWG